MQKQDAFLRQQGAAGTHPAHTAGNPTKFFIDSEIPKAALTLYPVCLDPLYGKIDKLALRHEPDHSIADSAG